MSSVLLYFCHNRLSTMTKETPSSFKLFLDSLKLKIPFISFMLVKVSKIPFVQYKFTPFSG